CSSNDAPDLGEALRAMAAFMVEDLMRVEEDIDRVPQRDEVVGKSASHLLALKGKRLRPMCVALAAKVGTGFNDAAKGLAAAVELVHSATLLHDDVVDDGTMRRGEPTARVLYGNAASVFAGDWLLIEALRRVRRAEVPGVLDDLLDIIDEMIQAEAIQLENRGRLVMDRATYFEIIEGKTASLFRWGLRSGGRAAGLSEAHAEALATYGQNLGIAFQIVDDALDFMGESAAMGKNLFADLREGKVTYPIIVGMERDPALRPALADAMTSEAAMTPEAGERVLSTLRATESIEASMALAHDYSRAATDAIVALPSGPAKTALTLVANASVRRSS
ncbi:MAG: polyprenyl synthetase family protein, partial [Myxococcota bacterium]